MKNVFTFCLGGGRVNDAARPPTPGDEAYDGGRSCRALYLSPGAVTTSRLSVPSGMADAAVKGGVTVRSLVVVVVGE